MKKIKPFLTALIVASCIALPLAAMHDAQKAPTKKSESVELAHTLTSSDEWGHGKYFQSALLEYMDILAANKNGKLRFNFNIITNKAIGEKIIALHKKLKEETGENRIFIVIDSSRIHLSDKKLIQALVKAGIPVRIYVEADNHWKAVLAEYEDEFGEKHNLYVGGSSNATLNALGNPEIDPFYSNYDDMYQEAVQFFDELFDESDTYADYLEKKNAQKSNLLSTPEKKSQTQLEPLKITPEKPRFLTSKTTDIWGSVIERFAKMQKGDSAYFGSYTFGHKDLAKALSNYAKKGINISLYIDKNSISGPARSQIEDMIDAGVKLFVYATTNRHLMHAKFALFDRVNRSEKKEEKKIVISTSQNAVDRGTDHQRIEGLTVFPNNPSLLKAYEEVLARFKVINVNEFKNMTSKELNQKFNNRPIVQLTKKQDIDAIFDHLKELKEKKQKAQKHTIDETSKTVIMSQQKKTKKSSPRKLNFE